MTRQGKGEEDTVEKNVDIQESVRLTFALDVRQGSDRPPASEIESDLNVRLACSNVVLLCAIAPASDVALPFLSTLEC